MMGLRDRIGIDVGQGNKIENGIDAAIRHGVRFLDLKIEVAPNAVESLTNERVAAIRDACGLHGIHVGIHTNSAVNTAEVAPHVRDGVDRYLRDVWRDGDGLEGVSRVGHGDGYAGVGA